jgi:hypothetical protein
MNAAEAPVSATGMERPSVMLAAPVDARPPRRDVNPAALSDVDTKSGSAAPPPPPTGAFSLGMRRPDGSTATLNVWSLARGFSG